MNNIDIKIGNYFGTAHRRLSKIMLNLGIEFAKVGSVSQGGGSLDVCLTEEDFNLVCLLKNGEFFFGCNDEKSYNLLSSFSLDYYKNFYKSII